MFIPLLHMFIFILIHGHEMPWPLPNCSSHCFMSMIIPIDAHAPSRNHTLCSPLAFDTKAHGLHLLDVSRVLQLLALVVLLLVPELLLLVLVVLVVPVLVPVLP
jgi:hypothetical protein